MVYAYVCTHRLNDKQMKDSLVSFVVSLFFLFLPHHRNRSSAIDENLKIKSIRSRNCWKKKCRSATQPHHLALTNCANIDFFPQFQRCQLKFVYVLHIDFAAPTQLERNGESEAGRRQEDNVSQTLWKEMQTRESVRYTDNDSNIYLLFFSLFYSLLLAHYCVLAFAMRL